MNNATYEGGSTYVTIDGERYEVAQFEMVVNNIAERMQMFQGAPKRVAVVQERQLKLMIPSSEAARLMKDMSPMDFLSKGFESIIAKELTLQLSVADDWIVEGVGMIRSVTMRPEGLCEFIIYFSSDVEVEKANENIISAGEAPNNPDDAARREERFKQFVVSKSRRQGQSKIAEAYNDSYNFFKGKKVREGFRQAAAVARRREFREQKEAERAKLFKDRNDVQVTVTRSQWERTEPKQIDLKDLFPNNENEEAEVYIDDISIGKARGINFVVEDEKPKGKKMKMAKVAAPKKRAIDL